MTWQALSTRLKQAAVVRRRQLAQVWAQAKSKTQARMSGKQRGRSPHVMIERVRRWLQMDIRDIRRQIHLTLREGGPSIDVARLTCVEAWSGRFRVGVLVCVYALALGLAAVFVWPASAQRLAAAAQDTLILKTRYTQVLTQSLMRAPYEEQIAQVEAQFGSLLTMIPASLETVQVLQQIARAAQASGLQLQWFKPAPEIREDAYVILPVDIRLTGSYHAVGRFLEAVSRMPHLITVDVVLEAVPSAPGQLALATRIKAYRGDVAKGAP